MKTRFKVLISAIAGMVVAWICATPLNLDSALAIYVPTLVGTATYAICDKIKSSK